MGHARALVNVDVVDKQLYVFQEIVDKGLSVRQTENLVRALYQTKKPGAPKAKSTAPPAYKRIEDTLCSHFGTRARVMHQKDGKGQIVLEYYSVEELNALLDKMKVPIP
jgi:ParB family chromosome partitioning protein